MNKPRNYTIEGDRIWNIRRSTAEALAEQGFVKLGLGDTLSTKHTLTDKGQAFFSLEPGRRRFRWNEDAAEPRATTTADYFASSMQLGSENFAPLGTYADERAAA